VKPFHLKTITRDTIRALMQDTKKEREEALRRCAYTPEDYKDAESLYEALRDAPDPFPPPKNWYLLTYTHRRKGSTNNTFLYDITNDIPQWIDNSQKYDDGEYVLVNYFPITEKDAENWKGNLKTM